MLGFSTKASSPQCPGSLRALQALGFLCLGSPQMVFSSDDDRKENECSPFIFLLFLGHEARGP